jgi:hypothetical protein
MVMSSQIPIGRSLKSDRCALAPDACGVAAQPALPGHSARGRVVSFDESIDALQSPFNKAKSGLVRGTKASSGT